MNLMGPLSGTLHCRIRVFSQVGGNQKTDMREEKESKCTQKGVVI